MLTLSLVSDTQFLKARELNLPVRVVDARTFVMPSASRPELTEHHRVTFDSDFDTLNGPRAYTCTCESFAIAHRPCWAVARALDVTVLLLGHNVRVGETEAGSGGGPLSAPEVSSEAARVEPPREQFDGRFENRRAFKVEPEGDPDALLVPAKPRGKEERVRGFQI